MVGLELLGQGAGLRLPVVGWNDCWSLVIAQVVGRLGEHWQELGGPQVTVTTDYQLGCGEHSAVT